MIEPPIFNRTCNLSNQLSIKKSSLNLLALIIKTLIVTKHKLTEIIIELHNQLFNN